MLSVWCDWTLPHREQIILNFDNHCKVHKTDILLSVEEAEILGKNLLFYAQEIKRMDKEAEEYFKKDNDE